VPLAVVLAVLGSEHEVRFGCAVFRTAVGIEEPQMRAFSLLLRPPLHQARPFAPAADDTVHVQEEDRVVAYVLGDQRVENVGIEPGHLRGAQRLRGTSDG
jgi:hypothetical protein